MASPPSSALAGAAVAAQALAGVLIALARSVPTTTQAARAALVTGRRIGRFDALRVSSRAEVAAIAAALVTTTQDLARATAAGDVASALYTAAASARACSPVSASPALTREYELARALCLALEIACLGEAFIAEARTGFTDRQSADAARARIRAAYDGASDRVAATLGQATLILLDTAARQASSALVTQAASLKPVIRVTAGRSFPAAALAWSLYADPERAGELMARANVGTPFFMPASFEALSPESV